MYNSRVGKETVAKQAIDGQPLVNFEAGIIEGVIGPVNRYCERFLCAKI